MPWTVRPHYGHSVWTSALVPSYANTSGCDRDAGLPTAKVIEFFLQCQSVSFVAVPPSPRFSFSRKRWKVDPHGMWSTASLSLSVCGCRGLEPKSNVKSEQQDQLPKTDRSAKNPYPNHSSSRLFFEEPVPVTTEHQVHDPPAGRQGLRQGRADPACPPSLRAGAPAAGTIQFSSRLGSACRGCLRSEGGDLSLGPLESVDGALVDLTTAAGGGGAAGPGVRRGTALLRAGRRRPARERSEIRLRHLSRDALPLAFC
jgi:hypothetical protein